MFYFKKVITLNSFYFQFTSEILINLKTILKTNYPEQERQSTLDKTPQPLKHLILHNKIESLDVFDPYLHNFCLEGKWETKFFQVPNLWQVILYLELIKISVASIISAEVEQQ